MATQVSPVHQAMLYCSDYRRLTVFFLLLLRTTGEPNSRLIGEDDNCLFDMGAEYQW